MTCSMCGCTEEMPCVDGNGDTCYWIIGGNVPVCSLCAEQPRVEIYSEAEANAFLREWSQT